ncbi:MAG TPA: hypothetical protein VFE62_09015, partial [Gemmataceae bacterium]|nr:hypothetical protein [Gemmataceae bacterium]
MNIRRLAIVLVFFCVASRGECQPVDAKKLCELIRLPKGSMTLGFGINSRRGFVLSGESVDHSAEIAALEKALCGDAMDAERYYRLSELYDQTEKRRQADAKAAVLFRKQLQEDPHNGRLAMRLGRCLPVENSAEIEMLLRRAVKLAPNDGECWVELGDFLWNKSFETFVGPGMKGAPQMDAFMSIIATGKVPPERLRASRKIAKEAHACMDRAVTIAPRRSRFYLTRATASSFDTMLDSIFDESGQVATIDGLDVMARVFGKLSAAKVFADLQKAAELEPTSPRAQAIAGCAQMLSVLGTEFV